VGEDERCEGDSKLENGDGLVGLTVGGGIGIRVAHGVGAGKMLTGGRRG
jgi:hypothetical protein